MVANYTGIPTGAPTSSNDNNIMLRVGTNFYLHNQINDPRNVAHLVPFAWCCIGAAVFVFIHDFYINRLKIHTIRILTHISALGCLSAGIFIVVGSRFHDKAHRVYLINIGVSIWSILLVKSADNIIFVMGYRYINRTAPLWIYILFFVLIFSTMFASWFLGYSLVPFFLNLNAADTETYLIRPFYIIYSVGGCLCNVYFSYTFAQVIYRVAYIGDSNIPKQAQLFAARCLLHGIFSTVPIILAPLMENLPEENLCSDIIITASIHLLFNCKIERYLIPNTWKRKFLRYERQRRKQNPSAPRGLFDVLRMDSIYDGSSEESSTWGRSRAELKTGSANGETSTRGRSTIGKVQLVPSIEEGVGREDISALELSAEELGMVPPRRPEKLRVKSASKLTEETSPPTTPVPQTDGSPVIGASATSGSSSVFPPSEEVVVAHYEGKIFKTA